MSGISGVQEQRTYGVGASGAPLQQVTGSSSTPQSDLDGVGGLTQPKDHTLPPIAAGDARLQQALDSLLGKSASIQASLTQVANLFSGSNQTPSVSVNDLLASLFKVATTGDSDSARKVLAQGLQDMITTAQRAAAGEVAVQNVCSTAQKVIDLLNKPSLSAEDLRAIAAGLAELKSLAGKAGDAGTLANGLAVIFSAVLDSLNLSRAIEELFKQGIKDGTIKLWTLKLPDSLAFSGLVTVTALMTLLTLARSQVEQDLALRLDQLDEAARAKELLKEREKMAEQRRKRDAGETAANDLAVSSSSVNSALTEALNVGFAGALTRGLADAMSLMQNKLIEAKQRSKPVEV